MLGIFYTPKKNKKKRHLNKLMGFLYRSIIDFGDIIKFSKHYGDIYYRYLKNFLISFKPLMKNSYTGIIITISKLKKIFWILPADPHYNIHNIMNLP